MNTNGAFRIEEEDIVRLESPEDNDGFDRAGWVNVGAFAVKLETDSTGNLLVVVYPATNESTPLAYLYVERARAMKAGATDLDRGD